MHTRRRPRFGAVLVALCAACSVTCSSRQHPRVPPAGCAPAANERLDPKSTIHLFPGAREPSYLTDPPTSGPHQLGPPFVGLVTEPIPRPRQVAMLESGFVIIQYRGVPASQLQTLAGPLVTVAPPVGVLPSPVVATAWTWKLECGSVTPAAVAALRAFITAHQGVGFKG